MKNWSRLLETLAGKLTAILAFAALIIIILALIGNRIPSDYRVLVYVIAIGAMLVFTYQVFVRSRARADVGESKPAVANSVVESPPIKKEKPTVNALDARAKYLNAVIADTRAMRLVGIDPQAADPSRGGLTLESLYVSLNTTTVVDKSGKARTRQRPDVSEDVEDALSSLGGGESRPLGTLEAIFTSKNRRMVLLGLPGTGKSTLARYLALRMAQAETDKSASIQDLLPGWKSGAVLPLILSLGRMAETIPVDCQKGSARLIENYIEQTLKNDERTVDFTELLLPELERAGGLVLFDGLDEVADLRLRPIVVQAVEDFVQKYGRPPASRFLVTCRTYSYYHDPKWQLTGWETHELALLDAEKIEYFVNAWHDEHIRIEPARKPDLENKRKQLLASLQPDDRRRLHEIAPFPIILTMMAVVHTHYGDLPDTRAEVYERCVDLLLVRWEYERPVSGQSKKTQKRTIIDELGVSRVALDRALWEIAFKAHEGREDANDKKRGPALVTEDLLTGVLQTHFQDLGKVQTFLDYCQSSNGLLMLQGSVTPADAPVGSPPRRVYAFPHLTFEEYLAARYLILRSNFGNVTNQLVLKSDRWREVVMLLGEYLCFAQGDHERMNTLLSSLTPEKMPTNSDSPIWRGVWYAGDLLSLYRRVFRSEVSPSDKVINAGLQKLVFKSALSPLERASAADTLDELGYAIPDLHAFIPIPKSPSTNYEFSISKYPVTNGQYERFLKSDFNNKKYWVDFQKYDENSDKMTNQTWGVEPWDWLGEELQNKNNDMQDGVLLPRYWRDPRFGIARRNAPVVGVSWYEASAYCNWLLENWENLEEGKQGLSKPKEIRLPLEKEWSTAAGGEDPKERYAWDKKGAKTKTEDLPRFANTSESGINRTTPVWMYPQGESPHGVMDMSGNVWEWQANYRDLKNGWLGLRGGSWFINVDCARVVFRYYFDHPYNRYLNFGFRVALFPSG